MLASAFLNRWLVVGVPPGWQLVSQVLRVLHFILLRGKSLVVLAESAVLSRCIILFTQRHVPDFSPAWQQLTLSFSTIIYYHQHHLHLSLILSVFLSLSSSLWGLVWHRWIPLTLPVICPQLWQAGVAHKRNRCKKKKNLNSNTMSPNKFSFF